jgi:Skp family chaperone for outer membrane proteins
MKIYPIVSAAVLIIIYAVINQMFLAPKVAYINTGKLMVGFSESAKIEKELKAEDDRWQAQYKALSDSLQAQIDKMSKEYNAASTAKKKELQDMLSARNQQVNNFKQANLRRMDELKQKKLQTVFDKANVFLSEYGKKHHYSIIFGTVAGGSILYGNESRYDITDEIIKGLNERYK